MYINTYGQSCEGGQTYGSVTAQYFSNLLYSTEIRPFCKSETAAAAMSCKHMNKVTLL